ncbi:unnamed protein product [Diamesa serratosioi]
MNFNSILLTIAFSCCVCGIQFQQDSETDLVLNVNRQTQGAAFFPENNESGDRYSGLSDNRKQLNFNPGNAQQYRPQIIPQYSNGVYPNYPVNYNRPQSVNPGRKRKRPKKPSQQANMLNALYSGDQSNPSYQNYANYYKYPPTSTKYPSSFSQYPSASSQYPFASSQYPSASSQYPFASSQYPSASSQYPLSTQYPAGSTYPDYYNPTRYPQQQQQQQQQQQPNIYSQQQQQQSLQNANYANQFGYQRPSQFANNGVGGLGNGISNFLNNIRETNGPLGQLNQAGGQFSKALEDISINDDLQCVPKLVCQMIRNPRRPNALPSFLNIPGLTAIIAALPSTSPLMNFGRAALLGLSGGECDATYPRCPRNEEQLLYYLNNHRGGFFRFFNGGAGFGEDPGNQNGLQGGGFQQQQQQHQQQQGGFLNQGYPQQQSNNDQSGASQGLNLLALQALADAVNQGNGINLANLFGSPSNNQPITQNYQNPVPDQSQSSGLLGMFGSSSFSDIFSNLLTGVVGNRFSRRISKRSISDSTPMLEEMQPQIQERIINLKENAIESSLDFFPVSSKQQETIRDSRVIEQNNVIPVFAFPNEVPVVTGDSSVLKFSDDARDQVDYAASTVDSVQNAALNFPQVVQEAIQNTEANKGHFLSPSDVAKRIRMLFPDRTGTGSLNFDSNHFDKELQALNNLMTGLRLGKILTGVNQAALNLNNNNNNNYNRYPNYNENYNQNYPQTQQSNYQQQQQRPIYYPSNNVYTGSTSSNNNNIYSNNYNKGQSSNSGSDKLVYITNSQGNIAYTLNELTGEKQQY